MTSILNMCLMATTGICVLSGPVVVAEDAGNSAPARWDKTYEPPRMADGTPKFEGIWSKASLTGLERPAQFDALVIPPEKARAFEARMANMKEERNAPSDPNEGAPEVGGAGVGGYNSFWIDNGTGFGVVDGEYRSSWIVDPADGKVPYSEDGWKRADAAITQSWDNYDDPEVRSAAERCTVGYGSTGTPPMLNVLYNNHIQFYQSSEVISLLVEMNHNARMIRMDTDFRPAAMRQWMGDSVGNWEGDTLVVKTTNFHPDISQRSSQAQKFYMEPDTLVEERFTRVADDVIFYEYTVTDPDLFTQPWKGEMPLWRAEGPIYEYACHEANYSLPGILAGARREESLAQTTAKSSGSE